MAPSFLGKHYRRPKDLCPACDVGGQRGYLALPDGAAELVFQVISERHERASLIITTNLPFGELGRVFPTEGFV